MDNTPEIVKLLETTPLPHAERIRAISSDAVIIVSSVISTETVSSLLKKYPTIISTYTDQQISHLKGKFQTAIIVGGWIYALEHQLTNTPIHIPTSPNLETFLRDGIKAYFYTQEQKSETIISNDILEAFKYCKTESYKSFMEDACFNSLPSDTKMAIILQYMWVVVMSYGAYKLQDKFEEATR